jgi:hypothetical protein
MVLMGNFASRPETRCGLNRPNIPPRVPASPSQPRLARRAELDGLRALAMLGVLLVHSAQVFSPWQHWHIQNADRSAALASLTVAAWPWIMPLFMFLAGIGTWYSLHHRPVREYVRGRATRLLVPFLLGVPLLVPPQIYLERLHQGEFNGSYPDFLPHFFNGVYPKGNLAAGHFWFLAYLLTYAVILLPLFVYLRTVSGSRLLDRLVGMLSRPLALLLLPALLLAASQVALRGRFPESLAYYNDWAHHAELMLSYAFGFVFAAQPALGKRVDRTWLATVPAAMISIGVLIRTLLRSDGQLPLPYGASYVLFWSCFGLATWSSVLVLVGSARRYLQSQHRALAYASGIVLPFYVLHQTVLVALAYLLVPLHAVVAIKFVLLAGSGIAVTVGLVEVGRGWKGTRYLLGFPVQRNRNALSARFDTRHRPAPPSGVRTR